jgi:transcriptional regulator with XRE-family HTH domain
MSLTPAQCRAARALVNLSQVRLARLANLSETMITNFENGGRMPTVNDLEALRRALEAKGLIFVEEKGDDLGVRLRKGDGGIRATWDPPPKR